MKQTPLALWVTLLLAATLSQGCNKHEEIEFSGRIIGTRRCTMSWVDTQAGYLVQLTSPKGIGGTINSSENQIDNVVVLYEPTCHILVDDEIEGVFYLDDKYSKANCGNNTDTLTKGLPEGVFLDISVVN